MRDGRVYRAGTPGAVFSRAGARCNDGGIVNLMPEIARLCSKERTRHGFVLARTSVFSPLTHPQVSARERRLVVIFNKLTMPSTANEVVSKRFCKKQQMQWSKPGAHLLLQTRVKTLNGELGTIFKRWYPDMDIEVEEIPAAV